jgi:glycosyltransferase involved in cell wall biosynthesis
LKIQEGIVFSIIIPTYNRGALIERAIRSVLNQTFEHYEIVIIDDGSTDNTCEIVKSFDDKRINYFFQNNAERSAARNNGISKAKGEWICFLDSDDEYLPNHLIDLNNKISTINTPTLVLTGNLIVSTKETKKHPLIQTDNKIVLKEIRTKFILMNSVCVHKSILENNKFDIRFRIWEDTHLWLRIAAQFPVIQIPEYTVIQHIHDESTVVQGMKKVVLKDVNSYILAINDLKLNYSNLFNDKIYKKDFANYIDAKYRMYLYQARQNKQSGTALKILCFAFINKPTFYLLLEFPKIIINKLGIGRNAK